MSGLFSIAIDGPSGAGKSSVARAVAQQLGAMYLDTGAMYRALGLYMLQNGIPLDDPQKIIENFSRADISVGYVDGSQRIYLGGVDVSEAIRTAEASFAASAVSTVAEVRARMVALQREIARGHSVVMDGRDIATHVLPDATLKIFLTASPEVRARRRHLEWIAKGVDEPYEKVLADLKQRDKNDITRAASPLEKVPDAIEVDGSNMTLDEVVSTVLAHAQRAIGGRT